LYVVSRLNNLSQTAKIVNQSSLSRANNTSGVLSNTNTNYLNNIIRTPVDSSRSFSDLNKQKSNRDTETYLPYNLYNNNNREREKENISEEKLKRDISRNNISRGAKENNISNSDISMSPIKYQSQKVESINDSFSLLNSIKSNYNNNSINQYNNSFPVSSPSPNPGNVLSLKQVGFDNLGNTCFMNTSLQCLIHTEPFMKRFFAEKDRVTGNTSIRPTPISKAIFDLGNEILKKSDGGKVSVAPSDFKRVFGSTHRIFAGYSQHDSQEFLRVLLDDISQELNRIVNVPKYRELDTKINDKVRLNIEYDRLYKAREDSVVFDTFSSQIVNIFTCLECNYETYSFEKYMDIPILLEKESYSGIDMSSLLDEFFGSDKLKWETPCENTRCKKKSYHSKFVKLSYLPEILMLSFQRNNGRARRKITSPINFKEKIDLSKFVDKDCIGKLLN
jgi:ubiquitin C-terminal hydrolase